MLILKTEGDFIVPVMLCDLCMKTIENVSEVVAVITKVDFPIRIVHKECKMTVETGERFMDMSYLMSRLVNDMEFDITAGSHITDMNKGI
jgi:hypothetical protein